jgi:integrase
VARERSLSAAEFAALGAALAQAEQGPLRLPPSQPNGPERTRTVNPQAVRAIRLLIFTGARTSEILSLRWEYLDLEVGRARLPDSKTGKKVLQLPAPALEVLATAERPDSGLGYVIRGRNGRDPEVPLVNIKDPWATICEAVGLQGLRLHDLRHAFASAAVNDGLSLPIIGALLGHRETRTTQRYAHLADDPQRLAAAQIAGRIVQAMRKSR